ncbi:hypothetical protein AAULH_13586, partial [Lactobacillus helveticus MTCC 5463]
HVSGGVLRISRLTGKTGLFNINKQDMGSIPIILNI